MMARRQFSFLSFHVAVVVGVTTLITYPSVANAQLACTMCINGAPVGNPDLVIPFFSLSGNNNPTCQDLADQALENEEDTSNRCGFIRDHAKFCGCPEEVSDEEENPVEVGACSLCPTVGESPTNINYQTRSPFVHTCQELDDYLSKLPPETCDTNRVIGIRQNAIPCGCPSAVEPCSMCSDGTSNMAYPDRLVPFFRIRGDSNGKVTCEDVAEYGMSLKRNSIGDESECQAIEDLSSYCGCFSDDSVAPKNACTLCPDGESVPQEFGDTMTPFGYTCDTIDEYLSFLDDSTCTLEHAQRLQRADFVCGCPNSQSVCPMCSSNDQDGVSTAASMLHPDRLIPYAPMPGLGNATCLDVAHSAVFLDQGSNQMCQFIQAQGLYCGCIDEEEGEDADINGGSGNGSGGCSLCPTGERPKHGDLATQEGHTCDELNRYLSFLPDSVCNSGHVATIQQNSLICGCPGVKATCPMCPDGTFQIQNPDAKIPMLRLPPRNIHPTCQDVVDYMMYQNDDLSDSACRAFQEQAGYCGCEGFTPLEECSLCPNGAEPTNSDLEVAAGLDCQSIDTFLSFLDEEGCARPGVETLKAYAYNCGCPDVTEPACTLCPDGSAPPKLETKLSGWDGSCSEGAESSNSVTTRQSGSNVNDHVLCSENDDSLILDLVVGRDATNEASMQCHELASRVTSFSENACYDRGDDIQRFAAHCGCPGAEFPQCEVQQNAELCTMSLLSTTEEECECYAFCDGVFVECQGFRGGYLSPSVCPGVAVTGCNRAGAVDNSNNSDNKNSGTPKENDTPEGLLTSARSRADNASLSLLLVSCLVSITFIATW